MICESCKQEEAKILLTRIAADQKQALHLCPTCAAREAQSQHTEAAAPAAGAAQVGDDASSNAEPAEKTKAKEKSASVVAGHLAKTSGAAQITCSRCGMTYRQFRKQGRFGCSDCYQAFAAELQRLMKRIHGARAHVGKRPQAKSAAVEPSPLHTDDLASLRAELEEAVRSEAYERAAALRDRITKLESGGAEAGNGEGGDRA